MTFTSIYEIQPNMDPKSISTCVKVKAENDCYKDFVIPPGYSYWDEVSYNGSSISQKKFPGELCATVLTNVTINGTYIDFYYENIGPCNMNDSTFKQIEWEFTKIWFLNTRAAMAQNSTLT